MNVILLKDVEKLGLRGEVVNVARGYARNYLLPRKLAEVATDGRVKEVKRIDAQKALHEARSAEQAPQIAETLGKTVLRFDVKSGPTGSLFGSVTTTDIADEIWRTRKIRVDRRKIGIDHIKRIGRYTVPIDVFEGVTAELKLMVVPEGGELPPEEELAAMEAAEAAAAAAEAAAARRRDAARGDRGGRRGDADVLDEAEVEVEEDEAGETDDVVAVEETARGEPVAESAVGDRRRTASASAAAKARCSLRRLSTRAAGGLRSLHSACGAFAEFPARERRSAVDNPRWRLGRSRPARGIEWEHVFSFPCTGGVRDSPLLAMPVRDRFSAPVTVAPSPADPRSSRRRIWRPRSPSSARCCSRRPRSAPSPRSSRPPTSTASRTASIYRAALALYGKGEPVDAITLANELDERSELERVGGTAKIAELAAVVPATSNAEHYARIVKEMATLRGLVRVGQEIQRLGQTPSRRDDRPRRPRRADGVRARAGAGQRRLRPHPRPAQRELRADHAPLRGGRRHHRRPLRASASSTSSRRASSPAT